MHLKGWKYEGRKISDKLHEQISKIVEILNDPNQVGEKKWPELQKYISIELGVATGQVRTIKRMMEELDILYKESLNSKEVPNSEEIFTENGKFLINLIQTEKLLKEKNKNSAELNEIKEIYKLYYQKVLINYCYDENGHILHPLRATLKAINRYNYLDYWEWYLLNTLIRNDNDEKEEERLDDYINKYRNKEIKFSENDIVENKLSHSYVLGNFEYCGILNISGKKTRLKITLNNEYIDIIHDIIN